MTTPYGTPKDSGPPDSSGESSGSGDNCPLFDWVFVSTNTNDWDEHTDRHVELRIQRAGDGSGNPGDCGGTNDLVQSGTATAQVTVPAGKVMVLDWKLEATVEDEDADRDFGLFEVDGAEKGRIDSQGNQNACVPVTPPPVVGTLNLAAGVHTLVVSYDTQDAYYHTEDCGVEFWITACAVLNA